MSQRNIQHLESRREKRVERDFARGRWSAGPLPRANLMAISQTLTADTKTSFV
jgi:hypothetical protein